MIKRIVAFLMASLLAVSMFAGCNDQSSNSRRSRNDKNDESETSDESAEALSFNIFNTTEDFNEMMDAYKDFYNEFCEENLKPYYENSSECDCAAMLVVNPDDNKIMMVIADIVGFSSSSGANVDLCFYEYSRGEVKEYLIIPNIWIDDTIFVGNIADGLYVSCEHPNGNGWEYVHYRIENGEAKKINQTEDGNERRISWHGSLTECIVTDNTDANFCVSERLFEGYLDYLKEHTPKSITDLKVIYGDYLLENGATTRPLTFIVYDGIEYYYAREEKLSDLYSGSWVEYYINGTEPDVRGYLFPRVNDLLAYEYPESIDGYAVYPFDTAQLEEIYAQIEEAAREAEEAAREVARLDAIYQQYRDYFVSNNGLYGDGCLFIDIDGDGTPELFVSVGGGDTMYYIDSDGNVEVCDVRGFIEGTGKFYASGDINFEFYMLRGGEVIEEYSLYFDDPAYSGMEGPVIYTYSHDGISEDITKDQFDAYNDTGAYTSVYEYYVYSSLGEAWLAYKY